MWLNMCLIVWYLAAGVGEHLGHLGVNDARPTSTTKDVLSTPYHYVSLTDVQVTRHPEVVPSNKLEEKPADTHFSTVWDCVKGNDRSMFKIHNMQGHKAKTLENILVRLRIKRSANPDGASDADSERIEEGQSEAGGEIKGQIEAEAEMEGQGEAEAEIEGQGEAEGKVGPSEAEAEIGQSEAEGEVEGQSEAEAEIEGLVEAEAEIDRQGEADAEIGQSEAEAEIEGQSEAEAEIGPNEAEAEPGGQGERDSRTEESAAKDTAEALMESEKETQAESTREASSEAEAEHETRDSPEAESKGESSPGAESQGQGSPEAESQRQGLPETESQGQGSPEPESQEQGSAEGENVEEGQPGAENAQKADSEDLFEPESKAEGEGEVIGEGRANGKDEAEGQGESEGQGAGEAEAEGQGKGESEAEAEGHGEGESEAEAAGQGRGESEAETEGHGEGESEAEAEGQGRGESEAEAEGQGRGESEAEAEGQGIGEREAEAEGHGEGESEAEAEGQGRGESEAETEGQGRGESEAEAEGQGKGESEAETEGKGEGEAETEWQGESEAETEGQGDGEAETEGQGQVEEEAEGEGEGESASPEYEEDVLIALVVSFSIVTILVIVGNISLVHVILARSTMRTKTANLYLMSLLIARACIGIFVVPGRITGMFSERYLGQTFCKLCHYAASGSLATSVFSIVAMAIIRLREVKKAKDAGPRSLRRNLFMISTIWIVGFLYAIRSVYVTDLVLVTTPSNTLWLCIAHPAYAIYDRYFVMVDLVVMLLLPLSIITPCYFMVISQLNRDRLTSRQTALDRRASKRNLQSIKMTLTLMALFIGCSSGPIALNCYLAWGGTTFDGIEIAEAVLHIISYSNAWVNVVVFIRFRHDLREAFLADLRRLVGAKKIASEPDEIVRAGNGQNGDTHKNNNDDLKQVYTLQNTKKAIPD